MFWPGNDMRWDLRRPWGLGLHLVIIVELSIFFNPLILIIVKYLPMLAPIRKKPPWRGNY
jgi:hypothetical protein